MFQRLITLAALTVSLSAHAAGFSSPREALDSYRSDPYGKNLGQDERILTEMRRFRFAEVEESMLQFIHEDEKNPFKDTAAEIIRFAYTDLPKLRLAAKAYVQAVDARSEDSAKALIEMTLSGLNEKIRVAAAEQIKDELKSKMSGKALRERFARLPANEQERFVAAILHKSEALEDTSYLSNLAEPAKLRPMLETIGPLLYFRNSYDAAARFVATSLAAEGDFAALWDRFMNGQRANYGDTRAAAVVAMQDVLERGRKDAKVLTSFIAGRPMEERAIFVKGILETTGSTISMKREFLFKIGTGEEVEKLLRESAPFFVKAKEERDRLINILSAPEPAAADTAKGNKDGRCGRILAKILPKS